MENSTHFEKEKKVEDISTLQKKIRLLNERLAFDPHNSVDLQALKEFNLELNKLQEKIVETN